MWLCVHGRTHTHMADTPPYLCTLTHTFPRSCHMRACSSQFTRCNQTSSLLTHKHTQTVGQCYVACGKARFFWFVPSWRGQLTFLLGGAPCWGWKEWLRVWVCVCVHLLSPVRIQWAHSWPRLNLTDSINNRWHTKEECMSVSERKRHKLCPSSTLHTNSNCALSIYCSAFTL